MIVFMLLYNMLSCKTLVELLHADTSSTYCRDSMISSNITLVLRNYSL